MVIISFIIDTFYAIIYKFFLLTLWSLNFVLCLYFLFEPKINTRHFVSIILYEKSVNIYVHIYLITHLKIILENTLVRIINMFIL